MNTSDNSRKLDQTHEQLLELELSDEALEAAAEADIRGLPTLFHSSYCFSCPS
jgi:hypothetical protein